MHSTQVSAAKRALVLLLAATLMLAYATFVAAGPIRADEHDEGEHEAALKVEKHDPEGQPLAGAVFTIDGIEGTYTTGEDGSFCLTGLPADAEYTVTETQAPDGYDLADPASQLVEVDDDGDCDSPDAVFVNTPTDDGEQPAEQTVVQIMKHVCPDSVQSQEDFNNLDTFPGDPVGSFVDKVLACPVITMPGDTGPDGALDADDAFFDQFVEGGTAPFNFTVTGSDGTQNLVDHGEFMPAQICESDLGLELDGNPETDVCVEVSHYAVDDVDEGLVTITESNPPPGFRFGSIEFTPNSGDADTLVSFGDGTVVLDTREDDGTSQGEGQPDEFGPHNVMVHVYNFANVDEDVSPGTGTGGDDGEDTAGQTPRGGVLGGQGGPGQGGLPDTAVSRTGAPWTALLGVVLLASALWVTGRRVHSSRSVVRARSR